jgi:hypothetical protein
MFEVVALETVPTSFTVIGDDKMGDEVETLERY